MTFGYSRAQALNLKVNVLKYHDGEKLAEKGMLFAKRQSRYRLKIFLTLGSDDPHRAAVVAG
ncbi:hypothetical protein [Microvirga terricola]|uniref:Uncharacterized protein n=1 Tax=Microvirga terricola TaxID=2719797 RepID=A0ABX0VAF8_9HYPH|nr:hypothetical protein [Microvirga terricola]NIX75675.1 hypothetical protein [Microvirga terricola]